MKKLVIDLDGTILFDSIIDLINEMDGTNYKSEELGLTRYLNLEYKDQDRLNKYMLEHNIYDYGYIEDNCIEIIKKLSSIYQVYIVTGYYWGQKENSDIMIARKFNFLKENFSFLGYDRFYFVGDKKIISADIAIGDDLVDLVGAEKNLLVTAYYNKHITDDELTNYKATRVKNWEEIKNVLLNNE